MPPAPRVTNNMKAIREAIQAKQQGTDPGGEGMQVTHKTYGRVFSGTNRAHGVSPTAQTFRIWNLKPPAPRTQFAYLCSHFLNFADVDAQFTGCPAQAHGLLPSRAPAHSLPVAWGWALRLPPCSKDGLSSPGPGGNWHQTVGSQSASGPRGVFSLTHPCYKNGAISQDNLNCLEIPLLPWQHENVGPPGPIAAWPDLAGAEQPSPCCPQPDHPPAHIQPSSLPPAPCPDGSPEA